MPAFVLPDLCDDHPDALEVLEPMFANYGAVEAFAGPARTVKCFEDNSRVAELVATPGQGAVLVVDGGGSMRCALLGDNLAAKAADNGWSGVIVYGCIRDVDAIAEIALGVQALAAHPRRSTKQGIGEVDVPVAFAGVRIEPGTSWVYADNNGIAVSRGEL